MLLGDLGNGVLVGLPQNRDHLFFGRTALLHRLLAGEREPFSQVTIGPKNRGRSIGSSVLRAEVYLALVEDQDFDCVAQYIIEDTRYYTPIQIKEFVPEHLNPNGSLQAELEKLGKYVDSCDLVVAIYLNRQFHLEIEAIRIPEIKVAELWFFGAVAPDASQFMLWGNMLKDPASFTYGYPGPNNEMEVTP